MGRMPTRKDENDRVALLQGTLDLLILRVLLFGPCHGQGVARAIQRFGGLDVLVGCAGVFDHYTPLSELTGARLDA